MGLMKDHGFGKKKKKRPVKIYEYFIGGGHVISSSHLTFSNTKII